MAPISQPRPEHDALFYETAAQYDDAVLSFVREGLLRGEPVLVAVPDPHLSLVRAALDGAGTVHPGRRVSRGHTTCPG